MLCVTSWGMLGSDTAWRRSNPDSTSQWWAFFGVCTGSPFWILWTCVYSTSTSESALEDQFQDSFSLAMDLPWHVLVYDTQNTSTPRREVGGDVPCPPFYFPHPFNSHQRTETFSYATTDGHWGQRTWTFLFKINHFSHHSNSKSAVKSCKREEKLPSAMGNILKISNIFSWWHFQGQADIRLQTKICLGKREVHLSRESKSSCEEARTFNETIYKAAQQWM